jgi:ATPase subunit of ABC transporter with duplicated ATPase domains
MLTVQNVSYTHPNKDLLFKNVDFTVNAGDKIALIGNNGVGKSTLLKLIAGELQSSGGVLQTRAVPYYIPQIYGQYNHLSVAQVLRIDEKLFALHQILQGSVSEENYAKLNDDWTIEERCFEALQYWQLQDIDLSQKIKTLSGGQKIKVFLAGILIHQPGLVLLDEPSNHLDVQGRELLYNFIRHTKSTLIVVSHDRKLLNGLNVVCELHPFGITVYGGNYDFYCRQKEIESNALIQDIQSKEKALKKAQSKEKEALERKQKQDNRAKKSLGKAGLPKIVANTWKNSAEMSASKIKSVHAEKTDHIVKELRALRSEQLDMDVMKFGFDNSRLHTGKILFTATEINISFKSKKYLWKKPFSFQLVSGERVAAQGKNGSGKTTLINIILGNLIPQEGKVFTAENKSVYIDQDYSLLDNNRSVYEQAQYFNTSVLQEHEVKMNLNRFLFGKEEWDKKCLKLSGGERMRLSLCCLTLSAQSPDLIILDEPTNNLDIQSLEILAKAVNEYKGTLLVVSHDETFLKEIGIQRKIML